MRNLGNAQPKLFGLRTRIGDRAWSSIAGLALLLGVVFWGLSSYLLSEYFEIRGSPGMAKLFLPTPFAVANAFWELAKNGDLARHTWISCYRVGLGFLVASAFAVPIGVIVGNFHAAEALVAPVNGFVRYLPVPALVPLTVVYFGVGDLQKVAVVFLGVFFQLILLVVDASRSVPRELIEVSECLGLSRWAILRRVIVPASAPDIFDACRTTVAWAWSYLVVAELVNHKEGITSLLVAAQRYLRTAEMLATIVAIGIVGVVTDLGLRSIGRRLFRWASEDLEN